MITQYNNSVDKLRIPSGMQTGIINDESTYMLVHNGLEFIVKNDYAFVVSNIMWRNARLK